ncbi:unnamed protein product [Prorocentrum cordatum]|uniref:Ubiquitin-like domain-containing protein n=1 Tax=Prorocentrum cordatum TaxID=2364126 RepID=A0ABN9P984_9DINO|nr:unnamed protein product [Polarella glacialis]
MATGWAQLCAEAGALRAAPPDFVAHLGRLYEARQWATAGGSLKRRRAGHFWGSAVANCSSGGGGSGPWRLKVDLAPPRGAPPVYRKDHRVVLVFGPDWPTALPTIRFVGKLKSCYARESDREGPVGTTLASAAQGRLYDAVAMQVFVRTLSGATAALEAAPGDLVGGLAQEALVFGGQDLDPGSTLAECGVEDGSTLFAVARLPGGGDGTPAMGQEAQEEPRASARAAASAPSTCRRSAARRAGTPPLRSAPTSGPRSPSAAVPRAPAG